MKSVPLRVSICLLWFLGAGCNAKQPPRFEVDSSTIDFGVLPPARSHSLELPVRNAGTGPLVLYSVATSCSCQIAHIPPAIGAGQTSNIVIDVPIAVGPHSSKLVIAANDKASPHELYLSWFGKSGPTLAPTRIVVWDARPGELVKRRVTLGYAGGNSAYSLAVDSVACSDPSFEVIPLSTNPVAKHGVFLVQNERTIVGETPLVFRCRAPQHHCVLRGVCAIDAVQGTEKYHLLLPIEVRVHDSVWTDQTLFFSAMTSRELVGKKRQIVLYARKPNDHLSILKKPSWLICVLQKPSDTSGIPRYVLDAEIVSHPSSDTIRSDVVIGDDGQQRVNVPISVATLP